VAWYLENAPEQVERLLDSMDAARDMIASNPRLHPVVKPPLRRVALRAFPYHLWFVVEGAGITVVAMTHFRQDTSYLANAGDQS